MSNDESHAAVALSTSGDDGGAKASYELLLEQQQRNPLIRWLHKTITADTETWLRFAAEVYPLRAATEGRRFLFLPDRSADAVAHRPFRRYAASPAQVLMARCAWGVDPTHFTADGRAASIRGASGVDSQLAVAFDVAMVHKLSRAPAGVDVPLSFLAPTDERLISVSVPDGESEHVLAHQWTSATATEPSAHWDLTPFDISPST